jgi:predicted negative regulator of RcsB-dependent stress response
MSTSSWTSLGHVHPVLAHGGTVGAIAESAGVLAILGLWGWVWWRSRGEDDEEALAPYDEAAEQQHGGERE